VFGYEQVRIAKRRGDELIMSDIDGRVQLVLGIADDDSLDDGSHS
jgi:hypothetical protein